MSPLICLLIVVHQHFQYNLFYKLSIFIYTEVIFLLSVEYKNVNCNTISSPLIFNTKVNDKKYKYSILKDV